MIVVELFCGSATISKEFRKRGHTAISIDNRKRKGICEPDLRIDLNEITPAKLIKLLSKFSSQYFYCDVAWISTPCNIWSYAAGDIHFVEGDPVSESAKYHIGLFNNTCEIIKALKPKLYFFENPRGRLRYQKRMIDFLTKNNGMIKEVTYGSYGFPATKPTNIFTNALDYTPRPLMDYGRGHKGPDNKGIYGISSVINRQKIPQLLAEEIVTYCEKKLA